ncbi:MAG: hypothetical protein ABR587_07090 [Candidatus Binatia bacterium]
MGLVARAVEEAGIATLTMTVGRDITENLRPPRAVFVDYPMGNEIGTPGNVDEQRRIVRGAFAALARMPTPGTIVDLGFRLEADSPDGRPWREWVYTKEFRRHHMKTREGTRPL